MKHPPIYLPFHWALRLLTPVTHSKFHPASTTTAEMVEASLMQILICLIYYLIIRLASLQNVEEEFPATLD